MAFDRVQHTSFPFDESPWIRHFHDADAANRRAQAHAASSADYDGSDAFAAHILNTPPGSNPFASYRGPFGEGPVGRQVTPEVPQVPQLYAEYFGGYSPPGALPGMGPFSDLKPPGAAR